MIKVFLVEDEYIVREGIKNNIDWEAHGYDFCGEASDGELAFPMIQELKPSIVITDIKMPFMDGLALSRLIKKELPWIEVIILSGYEEFEYAKEGIKLGVAQYLLKPINGEDLLKEVNIVAAKLEEKQKEWEIREKYRVEMEENFLNERRELFQYLVTGSKSVSELLEMAEHLEMDLSSMWYNIVLFHVNSANHEQGEYSNSLVQIEEELRDIYNEHDVLVFDRNLEGKALLFKASSKEQLLQIQYQYIQKIEGVFNQYNHINYYGGTGIPVNRLRELPDSFERASHVFAHRYFVNESQFANGIILDSVEDDNREQFDINNVNMKQIDRTKIYGFLKSGDVKQVSYFLEEFLNELGTNALNSLIFRQYITMDIYFCVVSFIESLHFSREEIEPFDISSGIIKSVDTATKYMTRIIQKAFELRNQTASNRYGDVVNEAMKYIEQKFADPELSLILLASHVNFSPNHLSMIFSQQTGKTFIKYLTEFRMNKAKELLRCTGKRNNVISTEVGYKDPHYFSYLFRKTQGMTPTQYRGGKILEGEE